LARRWRRRLSARPAAVASRWADPVVRAYKSGVDRTLLRENLRRTAEERFLRLEQLQAFAGELRRAGGRRP
jgi:hypothetical protein